MRPDVAQMVRAEGANVATDVLAAVVFACLGCSDYAAARYGIAAVCAAIALCRVLSGIMHAAVGLGRGKRQFWLAVDFVGIAGASVAGGLANAHLARFSAHAALPAVYVIILTLVAIGQLIYITRSRHAARTASFGLVNALVHAPVIYAVAHDTYSPEAMRHWTASLVTGLVATGCYAGKRHTMWHITGTLSLLHYRDFMLAELAMPAAAHIFAPTAEQTTSAALLVAVACTAILYSAFHRPW